MLGVQLLRSSSWLRPCLLPARAPRPAVRPYDMVRTTGKLTAVRLYGSTYWP
jgi:hypothetical protein